MDNYSIAVILFLILIVLVIWLVIRILNISIKRTSGGARRKFETVGIPDIPAPNGDIWNWSHHTAHFKLMGLNHYDIKEGHYEAYIVSQQGNPYDDEAIAVVTQDKKILGYLPRGNGYLFRELEGQYNRYLPVNVVIRSSEDGGNSFYYGYVDICLETYPDLDEREMLTGFE